MTANNLFSDPLSNDNSMPQRTSAGNNPFTPKPRKPSTPNSFPSERRNGYKGGYKGNNYDPNYNRNRHSNYNHGDNNYRGYKGNNYDPNRARRNNYNNRKPNGYNNGGNGFKKPVNKKPKKLLATPPLSMDVSDVTLKTLENTAFNEYTTGEQGANLAKTIIAHKLERPTIVYVVNDDEFELKFSPDDVVKTLQPYGDIYQLTGSDPWHEFNESRGDYTYLSANNIYLFWPDGRAAYMRVMDKDEWDTRAKKSKENGQSPVAFSVVERTLDMIKRMTKSPAGDRHTRPARKPNINPQVVKKLVEENKKLKETLMMLKSRYDAMRAVAPACSTWFTDPKESMRAAIYYMYLQRVPANDKDAYTDIDDYLDRLEMDDDFTDNWPEHVTMLKVASTVIDALYFNEGFVPDDKGVYRLPLGKGTSPYLEYTKREDDTDALTLIAVRA